MGSGSTALEYGVGGPAEHRTSVPGGNRRQGHSYRAWLTHSGRWAEGGPGLRNRLGGWLAAGCWARTPPTPTRGLGKGSKEERL